MGLLLFVWLFPVLAVSAIQVDHAHPLPEEADFPAVRLKEFYDGTLRGRWYPFGGNTNAAPAPQTGKIAAAREKSEF